jgi:hypothetical protein
MIGMISDYLENIPDVDQNPIAIFALQFCAKPMASEVEISARK